MGMKELEYEQFVMKVQEMPTAWLTQLYKELHYENEELHELVDEMMLDESINQHVVNKVVDNQVDIFNKMLAAGNVLIYRDKPLPVFEDT